MTTQTPKLELADIKLQASELNKELSFYWGHVLPDDDPIVLLMAANQLIIKHAINEVAQAQTQLHSNQRQSVEETLVQWDDRLQNTIQTANADLAKAFWARFEQGASKMNRSIDERMHKAIAGKTNELLSEIQGLRKEVSENRDAKKGFQNALMLLVAAILAAAGALAFLNAQ